MNALNRQRRRREWEIWMPHTKRKSTFATHRRHTQSVINLIHPDLFYSLICFFFFSFARNLMRSLCSSAICSPLKRWWSKPFIGIRFPFIGGLELHSLCLYLVNYCTKFIIHALSMPYGACQMSSNLRLSSPLFPFRRISFVRTHTAVFVSGVRCYLFPNQLWSTFEDCVRIATDIFSANNRYRFSIHVMFRSLRTQSINKIVYSASMSVIERFGSLVRHSMCVCACHCIVHFTI